MAKLDGDGRVSKLKGLNNGWKKSLGRRKEEEGGVRGIEKGGGKVSGCSDRTFW